MNGDEMSYLELILQRPLENMPTLIVILMGVYQIVKLVAGLFSSNQAIISQDNGLQGKTLDEMTARRLSDEKLKNRLMDLLEEYVMRIDKTTLRIDGTTLVTSAEVKAMAVKLDKFDKAMGNFYKALKTKGVI